jgi:hypothetical protein
MWLDKTFGNVTCAETITPGIKTINKRSRIFIEILTQNLNPSINRRLSPRRARRTSNLTRLNDLTPALRAGPLSFCRNIFAGFVSNLARQIAYCIFGIGVDRKHTLKWLFPQEKATFHGTEKVYMYSENAREQHVCKWPWTPSSSRSAPVAASVTSLQCRFAIHSHPHQPQQEDRRSQ